MNRTELLAAVAICVSFMVLIYVSVSNIKEPLIPHPQPEEVVVEEPDKPELNQKGRTDRHEWWPTWDADGLVYIIVDEEDRTNDRWISEWTPYGNYDMRCVVYSNGGVACFPKGEPSPMRAEE